MPKNLAIIAAAGSRKTETVIERALEDPGKRTLITTYTQENLAQIARRIEARVRVIPSHLTVMTWFSFLINHAIRPYQCSVLGEIDFIRGLNFKGKHGMYVQKSDPEKYFLDSNRDIYRNGVSDFACLANENSGGSVVGRLEQLFDQIFIDEVQDLVGFDLDLLDLLLKSRIAITIVGDPRQHTLSTNTSSKNKKYQGKGFLDWLKKRSDICDCEIRSTSDRCNSRICELASSIFPEFEPLESIGEPVHGQDGIHLISVAELPAYVKAYRPTILRWNRNANTQGLEAINIGVSKGSTYERVLIFPTKPMRNFLTDGNASKLSAPEKLYVAVTRARHSVGFVL
ncbi:MAG TPA: UvrD-helicase domain-containing protein [Solirubrobacterales bacterium]|nr:UvrD-helicase domain-containing protein [Solirubrobacterales bacterium]